MSDFLIFTLAIALLLSNLHRIRWAIQLVWNYLSRPRAPRLVPYFDDDGNLIAMVRIRPDIAQDHPRLRPRANSTPRATNPDANSQSENHAVTDVIAKSNAILPSRDPTSTSEIDFDWDFWPNGDFRFRVTAQQLHDTHQLATNWVLETIRSHGSPRASTWQKGYEIRRRCLGTIECHGKNCNMQLEPKSRSVERVRQLKERCGLCGETLRLRQCDAQSSLFRFRDGLVFVHHGDHEHSRFSYCSETQPDGSLACVEYRPCYQVRYSPSPPSIAPEDPAATGPLENTDASLPAQDEIVLENQVKAIEQVHALLTEFDDVDSEALKEEADDPEANLPDEEQDENARGEATL
ncbi:hypothetical protein R3P38DRAFT_2792479 [Favolaschia claudopus]|uniref:Uncharacterized protein n=1 Tax=Favolaschia claudopus TaxID=2862362 RepID=A0AAW0AEE3_9AGAR